MEAHSPHLACDVVRRRVIHIRDLVDVARVRRGVGIRSTPRMGLDPLVRLVPSRTEVPKREEALRVLVRVRVRKRSRAPQARYTARDEVLLIGGEVVARLGRVALLPGSETQCVRRACESRDTDQDQTGNLYARKSPAATNSSAEWRLL